MSTDNPELYFLAEVRDVPEGGSLLSYGPNGEGIALFKREGRIYALDNCCPHMDGPLVEGEVEEGLVTCPWHGWQFHVDTGLCVNMPGQDAFPIDLVIENDQVFLRG